MPKIVVDDFGGKRSDPGMLGSGIYFASSARYGLKDSYTACYSSFIAYSFIADPLKRDKQDSFPRISHASKHLSIIQINAIKFLL